MYYETALAYKGDIHPFRPYAPAKDREAWAQVEEQVKKAAVEEAAQHLGYVYPCSRLPSIWNSAGSETEKCSRICTLTEEGD